jgi:hypothetical protein
MAASVSTRRLQKADFRRDGPARQSQLAATSGNTCSRPKTDDRYGLLCGNSAEPRAVQASALAVNISRFLVKFCKAGQQRGVTVVETADRLSRLFHPFNTGEPAMKNASTMTALILSVTLMGAAASAMAAVDHDTKWQKQHPRREQVNNRLANQNKRIHNEVKEGEMTKPQAAALHKEDRQIRSEERLMASQNGGHITKQEQKTLNQQENVVSAQIGK